MINIPTPQLIDIKKIKLHPTNVKEHPESQINNLMQLIKWVGFKDPIVIDKDGELKAGHARLIAAERLGMTQVPWVPLEGLTKQQMDLFVYMDNKINESPWINANVELILKDIELETLELFDVEWDGIIPQKAIEEEPVPEPPVEPKSKLGDIYQLGNHRVMCGDSLTQQDILLIKKPNMIYTDPPYGLGGYAGRSGKFAPIIGDDDAAKFYKIIPKAKEQYIWGNWQDLQFMDTIPRDVIIWRKNNIGMGKGYRGQYEICMYYGAFAGSDTDVWEEAKLATSSYRHPTEKPPALCVRAIRNSSKEGDIVADLFLGSGSTLIACEQTNRICYGMEIDPGYVDVIVTRWENYTGKKAELLHAKSTINV